MSHTLPDWAQEVLKYKKYLGYDQDAGRMYGLHLHDGEELARRMFAEGMRYAINKAIPAQHEIPYGRLDGERDYAIVIENEDILHTEADKIERGG